MLTMRMIPSPYTHAYALYRTYHNQLIWRRSASRMDKWTITLLMLPVVAVSLFMVADCCDAEGPVTSLPGIESVEYVSVAEDGSFNPHITVYLNNVTDEDYLIMFSAELKYGAKTITKDTRMISGGDRPSIDIDISKSVVSRLSDGQYTLTWSNGSKSTVENFYVLTVDFKSNSTSYKSNSVQMSTDSSRTYSVPSGYLWNTENDGSGDWVTNVYDVTGGRNPISLFAFMAGERSINLTSATYTTAPNTNVKVLLSIANNPGCDTLKLTVTYDASVLTFKSAGNATSMVMTADGSSPGTVDITLDSTKTIRAMGAIVDLSFDVNDKAEHGQYPLTVKATAANKGINVPATAQGCVVIVGEKMRGDLNGDAKITVIDSGILKSRLAGMSVAASDSDIDVNDDGKVSVLDSLLMKKYLEGEAVVFEDFDVKKVSMTVKEGGADSTFDNVTVGSDVYIIAEGKKVTAATSKEAISVTDLGNGRFRFTAPSSAITVTIS